MQLAKDAIPMQQRPYRLNADYVAKVNGEINKLIAVGFIRPVKRAT
jgi:hypothetical protein